MQFFYTQLVQAGVPLRLPYGGLYFVLASAGVARKVGIQFTSNGQDSRVMPDMTTGFSLPIKFDGVTFTSDIDTIVSFFASPTPVTLGVQDNTPVVINGAINIDAGNLTVDNGPGNAVPVALAAAAAVKINNDDAHPVPIAFPGGVINLTASDVEVHNQPLATIVDEAPVVVGVAATALISDATLKKLRIRNGHATAVVGIGGAGVTLANAAIQLQPGDLWLEEDAAGAAWYAISDTAATNVQIQGLKL